MNNVLALQTLAETEEAAVGGLSSLISNNCCNGTTKPTQQ